MTVGLGQACHGLSGEIPGSASSPTWESMECVVLAVACRSKLATRVTGAVCPPGTTNWLPETGTPLKASQ